MRMGGSRGGTGGPDPPEKSQHYRVSEPDFYGDLVYKLKKIVGSNNFSAQFTKIISHYKKIGYITLMLTLMYCNRLHAW